MNSWSRLPVPARVGLVAGAALVSAVLLVPAIVMRWAVSPAHYAGPLTTDAMPNDAGQ